MEGCVSGSARRVAALVATIPVLAALILATAPIAFASTESKPADASQLGIGVALVALILLSGVLLLTRPKRAGRK